MTVWNWRDKLTQTLEVDYDCTLGKQKLGFELSENIWEDNIEQYEQKSLNPINCWLGKGREDPQGSQSLCKSMNWGGCKPSESTRGTRY